MSLTQDFADVNYIITGFETGLVLINNEPYTQSVIICPDQLIAPWGITNVDQLNEENLSEIVMLQPELVIIGTGEHVKFPDAKIIAWFAQQQIGLETMNTYAACRTYGILVAEGRRAVAALILP